jgi:sulfate adenylyltransferase subunit 1 (EFTu-like GTPase family)
VTAIAPLRGKEMLVGGSALAADIRSRLTDLEDELIHILREVLGQFERPVLIVDPYALNRSTGAFRLVNEASVAAGMVMSTPESIDQPSRRGSTEALSA